MSRFPAILKEHLTFATQNRQPPMDPWRIFRDAMAASKTPTMQQPKRWGPLAFSLSGMDPPVGMEGHQAHQAHQVRAFLVRARNDEIQYEMTGFFQLEWIGDWYFMHNVI